MDPRAARPPAAREPDGLKPLRAIDGGVRLRIRVQPRASRDTIVGLHGDEIRVRLAAPPVDGAANQALVAFMAAALNVPKRAVTLVSGNASRSKVLEIHGVTEAEARAALGLPEPSREV